MLIVECRGVQNSVENGSGCIDQLMNRCSGKVATHLNERFRNNRRGQNFA
jgi:hypothetical protein